MVSSQTTQLWTLAEDANEYERMHNLFSGKLKSVLNDEKISSALREKTVTALSGEEFVFALHDPCDIRKPYAKKLENIGRVRDLDGNMINGYSTFGTVCLSSDGQELHFSDISVFSNGDKEHYVLQTELDAVLKKQTKAKKKQEVAALTKREKEIVELLENEEYVNLRRVVHTQLKRVSEELKKGNENLRICHVIDRQMDGVPYFSFINEELDDFFVIRAKISRNSNETTVNEEGKEVAIKLKDVSFPHKHIEVIEKIRLNKKVYQDVTRIIEWGILNLEGMDYSVVRITLLNRKGKEIFLKPMLLITNLPVKKAKDAVETYLIYLKRAKIEGVFKFVKNALGWEEFQVQDWESIKNIIALAFFIGGYFYEIEPELANNPVILWLCQLGGGKGKITRHYFLEGLKNLLIHQQVERFRENARLKSDEWSDIMEFAL
jgi:hypothetical protein